MNFARFRKGETFERASFEYSFNLKKSNSFAIALFTVAD
jgi:hypothetical protein